VAYAEIISRSGRRGELPATRGHRLAYAAAIVVALGASLAACTLSAQDSPAPQPSTAAGEGSEAASPGPGVAPSPGPGVSGLEELEGLGEGEGGAATPRLREGTQLTDRLGRFRQNGEALSFIDESGRELGGLPNLSLERITNALKAVEEPESVWWSVSGTITEFGDRNYLLVTRAVYKAAALPPTPESVE
jgi:hypothetical protein